MALTNVTMDLPLTKREKTRGFQEWQKESRTELQMLTKHPSANVELAVRQSDFKGVKIKVREIDLGIIRL